MAAGPESSRLVGKLVLSTGTDSHAAPYCVLDHSGKVIGQVSPANGLDLGAYCNRTVTLAGTLVATPKDALPHLLATHVLGAELRWSVPGTARSSRQEVQPPVYPTAYQEPSPEVVPQGNAQAKPDNAVGREQKTLLRSPVQESDQPPALASGLSAPVTQTLTPPPPPTPVSPYPQTPTTTTPFGQATPYGQATPDGQATPYGQATPDGQVPAYATQSPYGPMSPPGTEPGPIPLPVQPGDPCNAGEPACGGCECCRPRASRLWVEADYLLWWTKGMSVPPLVTEGNADVNPGRLNTPGTTILFGGDTILDGSRSGGRIKLGFWFDDCHSSGIEGEYLGLEDANDNFRIWAPGNPVISRPFFDLAGNPRVELVSYPIGGPLAPPIAGSVSVDVRTDFQTAALRGRWEWFAQGSFCEPNDCSLCQWGRRVDVTLGYRYMQLDDNLGITEQLTTTNFGDANPNDNGSFLVQDSFRTINQFHGAEMGLDFQARQGRWTLELAPKIALGTTQETVMINGSTTITNGAGVATTFPGGLLALTSNMTGSPFQRSVFSVVPQTSLKVGYQLTPRLRFTTGYDFLYWSRVARAGSQIDLTVDAVGVAPPTGTPTRPTFAFQESGFWAQGLSFGLDYGW